jgi:hypothetical protein
MFERSRSGRQSDADGRVEAPWQLYLVQRTFKQSPVAGAIVCLVSVSVITPARGDRAASAANQPTARRR